MRIAALLLLLVAKSTALHLCVNCKFYKKEFLDATQFGKCFKLPVEPVNDYFLVNGQSKKKRMDYHYCSVARKIDSLCGPEAKHFQSK